MLAKWDADAEDHGLNADGNLECEPFYGNTCDQIYFKPGGELLNQCYLIYNKAWVEKQMKSNTWYALTSPLQDTYAGGHLCAGCIGQTGDGGVRANLVLIIGKQSCNQSCISAKLG